MLRADVLILREVSSMLDAITFNIDAPDGDDEFIVELLNRVRAQLSALECWNMNVSLRQVRSALAIIAGGAAEHIKACGVTPADFKLLTGERPWLAAERGRVRSTLDAVVHGSTSALGLPQLELPAEYVAAAIAMLVSPVNMQAACLFSESGRTVADLAGAPATGAAALSSTQLFALVMQAYGEEDLGDFQAQFEKRMNVAIEHALRAGAPPAE